MFICYKCGNSFTTVNLLIKHMYKNHKISRSGQFICFQGNCKRIYQNVNPFKKHLITIHSSDNIYSNSVNEAHTNFITTNPIVHETATVRNSKPFTALKESETDEDVYQKLYNAALSSVCDLYSNPGLNRLNAEKITRNCLKLITSVVCNTIKAKAEILITNDYQKNTLLSFISRCASLFDHIDTEYKFLKALSEMKLYVPPIKKIVDYEMHDIINNGFPIPAPKKIEVVWIPLRNSFKQFFELPGVLNTTLDYQKKNG